MSRYDLKAIRHKVRRLQRQQHREYWLEIRGREALLEFLAWELFWKIFAAYPDREFFAQQDEPFTDETPLPHPNDAEEVSGC